MDRSTVEVLARNELENKRLIRQMRNRESARRSRELKNQEMEDLRRAVMELERANREKEEELRVLRRKLAQMEQKGGGGDGDDNGGNGGGIVVVEGLQVPPPLPVAIKQNKTHRGAGDDGNHDDNDEGIGSLSQGSATSGTARVLYVGKLHPGDVLECSAALVEEAGLLGLQFQADGRHVMVLGSQGSDASGSYSQMLRPGWSERERFGEFHDEMVHREDKEEEVVMGANDEDDDEGDDEEEEGEGGEEDEKEDGF